MVKMDPFNVVSHNVAVCKTVSKTLNKDVLCNVYKIDFILSYIRNISNSIRVHHF
jgi:hypothetical protein